MKLNYYITALKVSRRKILKKLLFLNLINLLMIAYQKTNGKKLKKKPNIVIFEGWCVGVKPQKNKDLLVPINTLEKLNDKKKIWRTRVNQELKNQYKKIFNLIDVSIFLKVPSFKHVYKWRLLQEKKLKAASKGKKIMNSEQIKQFIMYYERLTKHMLKNLSRQSDILIKIDEKHKLKSLKLN